MVGDTLVSKAYPVLQEMESIGERSHNQIYLHDTYDTKAFWISSIAVNKIPLTRIINPIVEALKTRDRIPRYMIVIKDDRLVSYSNLCDANKIVRWMFTEITRMIKSKFDYSSSQEYSTL